METKVLFNKLNGYFKDNVRMSLINREILIIITKDDKFYCIDIVNRNIPSFILNNDKSVIESMIIKRLCNQQIIDLNIIYDHSFSHYYCFTRDDDGFIYYYDIDHGVIKESTNEEKIIDMCYSHKYSFFLTQSGKVYEYEVNECELGECTDYINFKMKSFKNYISENEKIVMISCGFSHSLALTESGRVFGWGSNEDGQLGVDVKNSSELINIELNDLKIKKISCGFAHSLLLSCDGGIYAFGLNECGEVGNGTHEKQRFPIKLELNNKFIDIASHPYYVISISQSIDGIYYVWGNFKGEAVLSPQSTKYESLEDILISNNIIMNIKKFEKLVEFKDSFVKNGFYSKNFEEIEKLGEGSFGSVFKVKIKEDSDYIDYKRRVIEYSAIKKIEFNLVDGNEIIREYLNYKIITENYAQNEYLVKHFDAWFEESVVSNQSGISLYIQMELCDKTENVIDEFKNDLKLKTTKSLTTIGYFIASQIFIQILEGVKYLHEQKPTLIHRDLKPDNILLKKYDQKGLCVKIADFGLITIHMFSKQSQFPIRGTIPRYMTRGVFYKKCDTKAEFELTAIHAFYEKSHSSNEQSHTLDKGAPKYMAPEVISSRKYNTKADIYSLGVIFENLFSLEMNE
jgi:hypothetical protein